jgi:hypothetical protein
MAPEQTPAGGDVLQVVTAAFEAIASGDESKLRTVFAPDASFLLLHNPYRIDDLKTFTAANKSFFDAGGKFVNFDIRQPRVLRVGDGSVVSFHFSQRLEIGSVSVGSSGRGTLVVVGGKVAHLHVSENETRGGVLPSAGLSASEILASIEQGVAGGRAGLTRLMWGCE